MYSYVLVSILNCFIFSFWRAVFIREFSFPLLLSVTYCTFIYVYIFLFCTLIKRIIKLKLKLKLKFKNSRLSTDYRNLQTLAILI